MSPQGGRSGGGSQSSGASSRTRYADGGYGQQAASIWTQKTRLFGYHFHDSETTASIIIYILCWAALVGIAIWSRRIRTSVHPSLKVFRWFGLGVALAASLTLWTLTIIDDFLGEFTVTVTNLYIIMEVLIVFFGFIADLSLIIVIFTIVSFRIKAFYPLKVQKGLVVVRCLILSTQISLFIASVYYYTRGEVASVESASSSNYHLHRYSRTLAGFRIVFFLISCLVLSNSTIIVCRSRVVSTPNPVPRRILLFISLPLFIRSLVELILTILYDLTNHTSGQHSIPLIEVILVTIPTVIVFSGIVRVGTQPNLSALNEAALSAHFTTPSHAILPGLGSRTTLASSSPKKSKDEEEQYAEFAHPMPPPSHAAHYKVHQSQQSWTQPHGWNQTPPLPQPQAFEAPGGATTAPSELKAFPPPSRTETPSSGFKTPPDAPPEERSHEDS